MHLPPLDVAVYPVLTMAHGSCLGESAPNSSTIINTSSSMISDKALISGNPKAYMEAILRSVFRSDKMNVEQAESHLGRHHHVCLAKTTEGSMFVLKFPPYYPQRALRHERYNLETEYKTLEMLHEHRNLPIPVVYKYAPSGAHRLPFLLKSCISGTKLSELLPCLSTDEKAAIDRTLGTHVRSITTIASTAFGRMHMVSANKGTRSWREAFHYLLESAIRDCEDMLVTLPYDMIRDVIAQHISSLDEVRTPCMVVMDVCDPQKVLIDERTKQVNGLLGFSDVIWGDPMLACVSNGNDAFFEGFGEEPPRAGAQYVRYLM